MRTRPSPHTVPGGQAMTGSLAATFDRLAVATGDGGLDLSARTGRPGGPGWIVAADLSMDRDLLEVLLDRIGRGCGVKDRAYYTVTPEMKDRAA